MALQAGDIIFKLFADDAEFRQGMANASRAVGAAMTAAGAAVTAFAASSIRDFASAGDEVQKMAARTGFSTESLSELRHAAELSGTSLDSVEKASKKLSTVIFEAAQGTETYVDTLGFLGLRYEDLENLTPEEQFLKVSYALAGVQDEAMRAALAQEVFGRAGTQLLPMLAGGVNGLNQMREEAHRLGIVFDDAAANRAAHFNDAMHRLGQSFQGFKYVVAEALIPTLIDLMEWAEKVIVRFREWTQTNPTLSASIIKISTAIGGLMVVLGPVLIALPSLLKIGSSIVTVFKVMGVVIGSAAGAIGFFVGSVAIFGYAVVTHFEEAKQAVRGFIALIWELINIVPDWLQRMFNPNSGLNPAALDRFRNSGGNLNMNTLPGAGGGSMAAGGGGNSFTFNMYGAGDPQLASEMLYNRLNMQLQAAGVGL